MPATYAGNLVGSFSGSGYEQRFCSRSMWRHQKCTPVRGLKRLGLNSRSNLKKNLHEIHLWKIGTFDGTNRIDGSSEYLHCVFSLIYNREGANLNFCQCASSAAHRSSYCDVGLSSEKLVQAFASWALNQDKRTIWYPSFLSGAIFGRTVSTPDL